MGANSRFVLSARARKKANGGAKGVRKVRTLKTEQWVF